MPVYCHRCDTCGKRIEQFRTIEEAGSYPACCFTFMPRDYQAERHEVGTIDGPSPGHYSADTGFHLTTDGRRICPNKAAWKDYVKRSEGAVADVS